MKPLPMEVWTGEFRLRNAPEGLTVNAVVVLSATQALVDLAFNGTDFDTDISIFTSP